MPELHVGPGEIIFNEGDASDHAYIILQGEVEIYRPSPQGNILLASLGEGQIFGEMGIIDDKPRSATARARTHGCLKTVTREMFINAIKHQPSEFVLLMKALMERLRETNQTLMNALAHTHAMQVEQPAAPGEVKTDIHRLILKPASPATRAQLSEHGVEIGSLPFRVGGTPKGESASPLDWNNLTIADADLNILSRNHFVIQKTSAGLSVADRGSAGGTVVNGILIGAGHGDYKAPLNPGSNRIIAGGKASPYQFEVIWE